MEHTELTTSQPEPWPPRAGQKFFLLWLGIAFAGWIAFRAVNFTMAMRGGPNAYLQNYWVNGIPAFMVGLAQGWLLFSVRPRAALWALLPLSHVAIPYLLAGGVLSAKWSLYYGIASIATIVFESILLVGVRRKPWLWLFIQLGVLVFTQLIYAFSIPWLNSLDRLAASLNSAFSLQGSFVLSGGAIFSSASQGLWLMGAILAAAALAWWMPPVDEIAASRPEPAERTA
jgi:hypothetical protein